MRELRYVLGKLRQFCLYAQVTGSLKKPCFVKVSAIACWLIGLFYCTTLKEILFLHGIRSLRDLIYISNIGYNLLGNSKVQCNPCRQPDYASTKQ